MAERPYTEKKEEHASSEAEKINEKLPSRLPLLPLRGLLVYPTMVIHLDVGRDRSVAALEQAMISGSRLILASQKNSQEDTPTPDGIYDVGTLSLIKHMLRLPNGTVRILIEGEERVKIESYMQTEPYYEVAYLLLRDEEIHDTESEALMRSLLNQFEQYIRLSKKISPETFSSISDIAEPGRLADVIASHLPLKIEDRQALLAEVNVKERLKKLLNFLNNEQEVLELERRIHQRVKKQMERTQKEYYLREQMKAIQRELGERDGRMSEIEELRERLAQTELPNQVREKIEKELERLERLPQMAQEGGVIRTYIDWLLDLPWEVRTEDRYDLRRAERILNEDHYGLEKVKERILEFLAVRSLVPTMKGPLLLLVGPPGVGKTSLGRSVARALERRFVRISLGGVRDEAEIRGHRRTYVGAMPGRIIQGIKKAGSKNPVMLLDEIDKMASDFRGDPASALLEVLDPEQNHTFSDHYIEEPFDLSEVLFIATANTLHTIPRPLMDRMEVISLSGYTEIEKRSIARSYLLPKQLTAHGLTKSQLSIQEASFLKLIREYTREAGVRSLDREIARLVRKAARLIVSGERKRVVITPRAVEAFLGKPRYRYGMREKEADIGVATGLAWTEVGGDILTIEATVLPGSGKLLLTGQLGDVMRESAQAALSYIRARAAALGIQTDFQEKHDMHIHIPEGAIPKDGPSAGITMATALVSALTGRRVRPDTGMTGEITLRGRVLPIGGLKEKSLAAHRAGLKRIIIPEDNEKDLDDIPDTVREALTFIRVRHMDEVLKEALMEA
ncbi:MAG: ATP-dependent protease La [Candidatus Carbobacillus altaicus]|uniref:Lon protease n=1 Tax=Candidatus Carbonibacillus altaicus TaxID=2163959 RepID=A0A2R6Y1G8_9BACL|nr:MAG: ATP-dependent protease La [Candidatus Carbobacillus altaicus]